MVEVVVDSVDSVAAGCRCLGAAARRLCRRFPALAGAPGSLRVIDPRTVYLRMPPSFLQPETLLMVLRNLMRQTYDREHGTALAEKPSPQPALVGKS